LRYIVRFCGIVLSPDRGTRRYSIAVGWGVGMDGSDYPGDGGGGFAKGYALGREDRPWSEPERAQMEVEARKLVRDFDARGGLVFIGSCPETDEWAGHFLYFLFQAGLTLAQQFLVTSWLQREKSRLGS
jgi:hypothetical protein